MPYLLSLQCRICSLCFSTEAKTVTLSTTAEKQIKSSRMNKQRTEPSERARLFLHPHSKEEIEKETLNWF